MRSPRRSHVSRMTGPRRASARPPPPHRADGLLDSKVLQLEALYRRILPTG